MPCDKTRRVLRVSRATRRDMYVCRVFARFSAGAARRNAVRSACSSHQILTLILTCRPATASWGRRRSLPRHRPSCIRASRAAVPGPVRREDLGPVASARRPRDGDPSTCPVLTYPPRLHRKNHSKQSRAPDTPVKKSLSRNVDRERLLFF